MITPATPSAPQPPGDDRNLVPVDETYIAPSFEDRLYRFLKNNRLFIITGSVIIVLGLVGKGAWELYGAKREAGIEKEYAAAGTPQKLQAFVAAHPAHVLAGIASLRLADEAYTAGKYGEAVTAYEKAAAVLPTGPLAARAQLGSAISKLLAGKTAEGEAALKQLSRDAGQLKGIRAEATYHLASFAADAGKSDEVVKYSDQLMQLDPASGWTQRALGLRATLPTPPATQNAGSASSAPEIQLPLKQ